MTLSRQNSQPAKVAFAVVILAALATWRQLRRLDPQTVQVARDVGVVVLYRTEQQQAGKGCGLVFPPLDGFGPLTPLDNRRQCFVAEPLTQRTIH